MPICLIGNGIYRVDGCTAYIVSDGSLGREKFNFPSTDFRAYVLKKESGCGFIGSGVARLLQKSPFTGEWWEVLRANTPSAEGYAYAMFDIIRPGNAYWKIEWDGCVKEFISGTPEAILPIGEWTVTKSAGATGGAEPYDGGVKLTLSRDDRTPEGKYPKITATRNILLTDAVLKFNFLFESTGSVGGTYVFFSVRSEGKNVVGEYLVQHKAGSSLTGSKEYDLTNYVGKNVDVSVQMFGFPKMYADIEAGIAQTASFTLGNVRFCTPLWVCEQPLNGFEQDVFECFELLPARRHNPDCEPCIPNWQCRLPYDGIEEDGCGNSRSNPICLSTPGETVNTILNGGFDNNLDGWTVELKNEICSPDTSWKCYAYAWWSKDVVWDNGRARLSMRGCNSVFLSQEFKITGKPLTFDYQASHDASWGETPGYEFLVEGERKNLEYLPFNSGTITIDTAQYIGKNAKLMFFIIPANYCYFNDHGTTYLWIDNVNMPCSVNWQCEQPLNGFESDGCGRRRASQACNPCVPNWQCEPGQTGYEIDGCGNRRENPECMFREATLISCLWPPYPVAGKTDSLIITVLQGSKTGNYKLVFSGGLTGESEPFSVDAGEGEQSIPIPITFESGGQKSITATLVKV